jgi:hypothetical protein
MIFSTIACKTSSKTLIDPQNSSECSLTNNIVMVSSYLPIQPSNSQQNNIQVSVDKGANSLRTSLVGA